MALNEKRSWYVWKGQCISICTPKYNYKISHDKWHDFISLLNMKNKKGKHLCFKIAHHCLSRDWRFLQITFHMCYVQYGMPQASHNWLWSYDYFQSVKCEQQAQGSVFRLRQIKTVWVRVKHSWPSSTPETEVGGLCHVRNNLRLDIEFQDIWGDTMRPCFETRSRGFYV